jgi:hypothetical protein
MTPKVLDLAALLALLVQFVLSLGLLVSGAVAMRPNSLSPLGLALVLGFFGVGIYVLARIRGRIPSSTPAQWVGLAVLCVATLGLVDLCFALVRWFGVGGSIALWLRAVPQFLMFVGSLTLVLVVPPPAKQSPHREEEIDELIDRLLRFLKSNEVDPWEKARAHRLELLRSASEVRRDELLEALFRPFDLLNLIRRLEQGPALMKDLPMEHSSSGLAAAIDQELDRRGVPPAALRALLIEAAPREQLLIDRCMGTAPPEQPH